MIVGPSNKKMMAGSEKALAEGKAVFYCGKCNRMVIGDRADIGSLKCPKHGNPFGSMTVEDHECEVTFR